MAALVRLGTSNCAPLFVPISFIFFFATPSLGDPPSVFLGGGGRHHDGLELGDGDHRAAYHARYGAAVRSSSVASEGDWGRTHRWFDGTKWQYLLRMFRDRWETFDIVSAGIVLAVPLFALIHPRLTLSRNLAFSGLVLAACYVLMPRIVFGSAYADMRLVPFAAAIFILAVRFKNETRFPLATWLALAAVGFMLVRTAGTTASMAIAWKRQSEQLKSLTMS